MPTTLCAGRPEDFCNAQTIASSGLVMQMTKASGALALMPAPTAFITFRLMPSRSSRLMPGLRGTPAVTMHHVGAGDVGVVAGAGQARVEAVDRRGFGQVQRLALRHAVDDVEQDDVAQFLERGQVGQGAADLAGADQGDLLTRHGICPSFEFAATSRRARGEEPRGPIALSRVAIKPNFWRKRWRARPLIR